MSTINLAAVADILEKVIHPAIVNQMSEEFIGYQMARQEGRGKNNRIIKFDNDSFYIPLQVARHSGAVAIAESGTLVNGKPTTALAKIMCKWQTGSQLLTKQSLSVDAGAVVPVLTNMGRMLVEAMKADKSRQFYGTGDAVIGTANGAGSPATAFVFKASPNDSIDYAEYCPPGTQLKIGSNSAVEVSAVTGKNAVTIPSTTWSADDEAKKCDGAGAVATELTGMQTLLSNSATFQNLAVASVPSWVPAVINSTSEALTLNMMDQPFLKANRTGKVTHLLLNEPLFRSYGQKLVAMKRSADPKKVLSGHWSGLDFAGGNAEVVLDWDCPDDWIMYMSPEFLTYGENQPLEWERGTDGTLLRVAGKIDFEAVATEFGEFGCHKRNAFAALTGKTP